MKLVVCYSHGGYEGTWTENVCVEYESKDHFLVAFIDAFDAWAVAKNGRRELERRLSAARSRQDEKKIAKAFAELLAFTESEDYHVNLVVDGMEFWNFEDYSTDKHGVMTLGELPDVYTLDEWFERNRPSTVS